MKIIQLYEVLLNSFGEQNWWPVYSGEDKFLEVSIGAILTQNTNWNNVEKALKNLINAGFLNWDKLLKADTEQIKQLIKPAGFYNQKAIYIKNFVSAVYGVSKEKINRSFLLSIKGIGEETADSILLYGLDRLYFVVDAYTKRIFYRTGLINRPAIRYGSLQQYIQQNIPPDLKVYKEFHALIVELGKRACRKKPLCAGCPVNHLCLKRPV
ncbi:endonuclease [Persephonella sp.]